MMNVSVTRSICNGLTASSTTKDVFPHILKKMKTGKSAEPRTNNRFVECVKSY